MTQTRSRGDRLCLVLAALAYLAIALFVLRPVLPDPSRLLPYNTGIDAESRQMGHFDQSMVVSVVTRNANVLLTEPWNLRGDGQCHPFPRSFTLGEHMFGEGLQMAVPWALTRDPVLAYNLMLVLTLWLPGVTMYALSHHFMRHAGAAFVAGLLFVLVPTRIIDGGHPYLHADFWLPLVLLALHRLFAGSRRALPAVAIGVFLALEALETIYVLLACAMVAGVYGVHLAVRYRERLGRVALPLGASVAFAAGVAWWVLSPYLETRATWDVLRGRPPALFGVEAYAPGTPYFFGIVAIVLVALGLLDRLRGPREVDGDDPRLALLVAALATAWASLEEVPIPGTGFAVPGPLRALSEIVPGLDAVRGLFAINVGVWTPLAFLAGYGALLVLEPLRGPVLAGATAILCAAVLGERFVPAVSGWSFGRPLHLGAWNARPPEEDIDLVRTLPDGPVFDVPVSPPSNSFARMSMSRNLLLQSWNPAPSSSCYNSFDTPLAEQVYQLSTALPSTSAAEAIAALGFTSILSHRGTWEPHAARWGTRLEGDPEILEVMRPAGRSSGLEAYRLHPKQPVHEELRDVVGESLGAAVELRPPDAGGRTLVVPFLFHNPGPETFRQPAPLEPADAELRWLEDGEPVGEPEPVRVLWPIALGGGGLLRIDVATERPPPPGEYRVTLAAAEDTGHVLATRDVVVPPHGSAEERAGARSRGPDGERARTRSEAAEGERP